MSWGSEGHFEAPVGPGKLHIFTSKKHQKWWRSVLIYFISRLHKVLSWEIIVINWINIMNMIFKKRIIRRSYPSLHFHINYVQSFQEICIYFDRPRHPNGWQWPMTGHYLQLCNLVCKFLVLKPCFGRHWIFWNISLTPHLKFFLLVNFGINYHNLKHMVIN